MSAHDDQQYADPTKATTYTLIAYQPSWSRHEGCHCHGTTQHFDSNFEMERGLTFEKLAQKMATYRTSVHECGETGGWEFKYFDDQAPPDWDDWDRWAFDDALEKIIQKQEPIIKARKEAEAKAAAEKAAEAEKIRRQKYEAEQREQRDREEYARLKTKYAVPPK